MTKRDNLRIIGGAKKNISTKCWRNFGRPGDSSTDSLDDASESLSLSLEGSWKVAAEGSQILRNDATQDLPKKSHLILIPAATPQTVHGFRLRCNRETFEGGGASWELVVFNVFFVCWLHPLAKLWSYRTYVFTRNTWFWALGHLLWSVMVMSTFLSLHESILSMAESTCIWFAARWLLTLLIRISEECISMRLSHPESDPSGRRKRNMLHPCKSCLTTSVLHCLSWVRSTAPSCCWAKKWCHSTKTNCFCQAQFF